MRFINDSTWKYQFPLPADPETLRGIMEELIILILLVVSGAVLVMPIIALVSASKTRRQADELGKQVGFLREQQARTIEREARLIQRIELLETVNKMPRSQEEPAVVEAQAKYAPPPLAPPGRPRPAPPPSRRGVPASRPPGGPGRRRCRPPPGRSGSRP
jgi:hypothetical protein